MTATGCPAQNLLPAFLEFPGRDGVAQRAFFENPGSPKLTQNRPEEYRSALWWAKIGQNDHPERGPETGSENEAKKGLKKRAFGIVKSCKSTIRSSKIKVFGFLEKT